MLPEKATGSQPPWSTADGQALPQTASSRHTGGYRSLLDAIAEANPGGRGAPWRHQYM